MTDFGEVFVRRTRRDAVAIDWDPDLPALAEATPALRRLRAATGALKGVPALTVHDTLALLAAPRPQPPPWLFPSALGGQLLALIDDVPKMGAVVVPGASTGAVRDQPLVAWSQVLLPAVMDGLLIAGPAPHRWFDQGLGSVPWLLLAVADAACGPLRLADEAELLLREIRGATPPGERPPRRRELRERLRALVDGYRELGLVEGSEAALTTSLLGRWALTVLVGMGCEAARSAFTEVSSLPSDVRAPGGGHASRGAGGTAR